MGPINLDGFLSAVAVLAVFGVIGLIASIGGLVWLVMYLAEHLQWVG